MNSNLDKIKDLCDNNIITVVFSNPAEGSETILNHCSNVGILDRIQAGTMSLITGGSVPDEYNALYYENFLPKILDYDENISAVQDYQQRYKIERPYKFLFLNGRQRDHRRYLLKKLNYLLDQTIWTNLDAGNGPIKLLDPNYEFDKFFTNIDVSQQGWVKPALFGTGIWGDIYIKADPYLDTYFSLVSETVHRYPYSFRTEKIWKPIAIGHPWITVANKGYYRDIQNIGFKTFGYLIDESFDTIDDNYQRLDRVANIVNDLCQQDLSAFLEAAQDVCKYNQQHLAEMRLQVRQEFPNRFSQFINERSRI
jgi:hypothetical protein